MRWFLPKHLLLILALALGQWLAVAHAHEHAPLAVDQVCQICLHAPGIDTGALGGKATTPSLPTQSEVPQPALAPAAAYCASRYTAIRGPPAVVC